MKTALVFAAHPDDEVLGCGGTIAKLSDEGWSIHVVIMAEGATSRSDNRNVADNEFELSELANSAQLANQILGVKSLTMHHLPDNRMDALSLLEVVKTIESEIIKHKPSLVMTHHAGDVNIDHRILQDAVITACRPQPDHPVKSLLFFEIASSTEWRPPSSGIYFSPNYFSDISKYLEAKMKALELYQTELRNYPHPRSLEAITYLAKWRGATVGCNAAEAFVVGRIIT
jgi:N-acetylglucosamine malate deacetylase 1